jgi:hypothetical protein
VVAAFPECKEARREGGKEGGECRKGVAKFGVSTDVGWVGGIKVPVLGRIVGGG